MAQYERFLSYLFEYEQDAKGDNCGFAKIEVRGETKRIQITVKGHAPVELLHVCGFYREGTRCTCVPLGRMMVNGGNGQFQYVTTGQWLRGSQVPFERLSGLVISNPQEHGKAYATVWDDEPFGLSMFERQSEADEAERTGRQPDAGDSGRIIVIRKKVPGRTEGGEVQSEADCGREAQANAEAEGKADTETEAETETETEGKAEAETETEGKAEAEAETEGKAEAETETERKAEAETETERKAEAETKTEIEAETQMEEAEQQTEAETGTEAEEAILTAEEYRGGRQNSAYEDDFAEKNMFEEPLPEEGKRRENCSEQEQPQESLSAENADVFWAGLCRRFQKIETLPGDRLVCLKAVPADIGRLPRPNWIFGNNGFLMCSYVKYRYIVFARVGREAFELWVPGTYGKNEELLAEMFGFETFRSMKSVKAAPGDFGYWCVPLIVPRQQQK